jgi:hypothetical protein
MFQWLKGREGSEFADPGRGGGPRYLGPLQDQPFPLNPLFRSQPVLDEQTRELIWDKVIGRGESLKAVSAEMGVDVRRIAAVVRLKEVEKQWQREVSYPVVVLIFVLYLHLLPFPSFFLYEKVVCVLRDETIFQNSISLEDFTMVKNDLHIVLITHQPPILCYQTCPRGDILLC